MWIASSRRDGMVPIALPTGNGEPPGADRNLWARVNPSTDILEDVVGDEYFEHRALVAEPRVLRGLHAGAGVGRE